MRSIWTIVLHSALSLVVLAAGLYILFEKKMIISGKLTGHVYEFEYPGNVIIASSFFLVSLFLILVLRENKRVYKVSEWLLISALVLFIIGAFI